MRALLLPLLLGLSVALPALADGPEQVLQIKAKRFEFIPPVIELKKGVPVVLEFVALDRKHGVRQADLASTSRWSPASRRAHGWCPRRRAPTTSPARSSAAAATRR